MTLPSTNTELPHEESLRDQGIAALRAGDLAQARSMLLQAVQHDSSDAVAWLWLSGAVATESEQRFCLEQVLSLVPNHAAAIRGLALVSHVPAVSPLPTLLPTESPVTAAPDAGALPLISPRRTSIAKIVWVVCGVLVLMIIGLGSVLFVRSVNGPGGASLTAFFGSGVPPVATAPSSRNPEVTALIARGLKRERLDRDSAGALADYTDALTRDPQAAEAYYLRGALRAQLGDAQAGMADYQHAKQLDPDPARAAYHWGRMQASLGNLQASIDSLTQAIQLDSQFAQAYYTRGVRYIEIGDRQAASADFSTALRVDPHFAEAYYNRGNLEKDAGDATAAIDDYTAAIQAAPDFFSAYFNRGYIYRYAVGDLQHALADFNAAVNLRPSAPDALCERGGARAQLGDVQGGLDDTTHALEVDPQWACAYFTRGTIYFDLRQYANAITDYTHFIDLVPQAADGYIWRGLAYSKSHDDATAVANYTRAIQLAPNNPLPYNNRGQSYVNLGQYQSAAADWRQAAQLYAEQGQQAYADRLLQAIKQLPGQ